MADKLDWLGRHLVLIRHITVADAVSLEAYKVPPDLEDLFAGAGSAEEMAFKLAARGKHKNACELLAYIAHRRAAVWWGYRCVCSVNEELRLNPPEDIDYEKPPEPPPLPDYFNIEVPKPDPALAAAMDAALAGAQGDAALAAARADPAMKDYVAEGVERAFRAFEEANGVHPMALLKTLGERMKRDPYAISPDSPIFRMEKEMHEKLDPIRGQVIAEVKEAHAAVGIASPLIKNPKLEAHKQKLSGNALDAVYRWVAAPDGPNAQKCLDAGNACPDEPGGVLSLSAFWAFGNLAPQLDQVIPTPPGLAANGIDKVLLLCAVKRGGTRKILERYEHYFNLGLEVLTGSDNWEDSLAAVVPPHREASGPAPENVGAAGPPEPEEPPQNNGGYKRWKPPEPEPEA
ncbi:MAG: hypothetical protein LBD44_01085 [Spirochaetaceae bacterium]|jgi:hypothetical protein|nr:hypothetical protein [Spirochaetaceae bacterium]